MKKVFLFLTIVAFCFMIVNAATTFTVDGYKYTVISEDESTVEFGTGAKYGKTKTNVVVPATVEYGGKTYTVIGIGQYAFGSESGNTTTLLTVELPNTIQYIGKYAFSYCGKLQNFQLPQNLETISNSAFEYAFTDGGTTIIVLPESVKTLEHSVFLNAPLETLVVGKNVESIGDNVANKVENLVYNATNASYITNNTSGVPSATDYSSAFSVNSSMVIGEDVCELPICLVEFRTGYNADLIIPDKVQRIVAGTFKLESGNSIIIQELVFGKNVKLIEANAFPHSGNTTIVNNITCRSKIPPVVFEKETAATPSFNSSINFNNCSLKVPVGTENTYRLADFWRTFVVNMEEDEELGDYSEGQVSSDGFSFTQNSNIIETQSNTILPISITNKYPVVSIEFDMELPANIELGTPVLSTTDRTEGATISTSTQADGSVHVVVLANGTIATGKGAILNLNIVASMAGNYDIRLKNVVLTTGQEITLDDENLQFVANHKKGDYNEDGDVDIVDAQNLLDYVLGI